MAKQDAICSFDAAKAVRLTFVFALAAEFVLLAWQSLGYRYGHDTPIMLYMGLLMRSHRMVPYRDWFDMNLPGAYWVYGLIGALTRCSNVGIRLADLTVVLITVSATWLAMSRIGSFAASITSLVYGIAYISGSPNESLQRELFIIALISIALCLLARWPNCKVPLLAFLVSVLVGVSVTIKPQALLVWPVVTYFILTGPCARCATVSRGRSVTACLAAALVGLVIPIAFCTIYLWRQAALVPFLDIAMHYLPLYGSMNGDHIVIRGFQRVQYLIHGFWTCCGYRPWAAIGLGGAVYALWTLARPSLKNTHFADDHAFLINHMRFTYMLCSIFCLFAIYPMLPGQFWHYHGLPLLYSSALLIGLYFVPSTNETPTSHVVHAAQGLGMAAVLLVCGIAAYSQRQQNSVDLRSVDEAAAYLKSRMAPGDKVQPLDWAGGAVHAMLTSNAVPATRFLYDFHFYHNTSSPYNHRLRREFMAEFETAHPRFVVRFIAGDKPAGPDSSQNFPELEAALHNSYSAVIVRHEYILYERRTNR